MEETKDLSTAHQSFHRVKGSKARICSEFENGSQT